ncbi:MAG: glycosyltransferase family 39 protein [Candidatus Liptonbacteria bacterium]|nr:glycosyltransferase family 39 protein [Candidatus Liptonbacteria bacterium]
MSQDQSEQKTVVPFLSTRLSTIVFLATLTFVIVFSFSTLVTKPRLWTDEAVSIDIARSFLIYGVLSPQIAPGALYSLPHLIQSTGYPVTVALASVFKIFGYGLYQARTFMLVWMLAVLAALFYVGRKIFDDFSACSALLLIASFASFYGSGRTVVGEIPGFLFLISGLYFLFFRERLLWSGLFLGLAVVTKPSVFGLLIPTLFFATLLEHKSFSEFCRKLFTLALGMIPAALGWIIFVLQNPFNFSTWASLGNFYKNPYSSSIAENIIHNLYGIFHSTTLIYFIFLAIIIITARFFIRDHRIAFLYDFVIIYGIFAFLYYLRSPGWLRYILIAELLILFLLPNALFTVVTWFRQKFSFFKLAPKNFVAICVTALVCVQLVQMFTVADIFYSDGDLRVAKYINNKFPQKSTSFLNALNAAVLAETLKRYNTFTLTGMPLFGTNTLLGKDLPEVIVSHEGDPFLKEGKAVLDSRYVTEGKVAGYSIYIKK